jgi:twitching motility protein PilT
VQTINRVINVFPAHQQVQIRTLMSFVLQGIVSQQLITKSYEKGRVAAMEILVPTSGIRNLIREDKMHQIYSQMQIGQDKSGMITMNQSLKRLVETGAISPEVAMSYSNSPDELATQLGLKVK